MTGRLAEYTLESAIVLGCCAGLTWLLRNRSAAVRHTVWSAGSAIVLLLAPLSIVQPRFGIPIDRITQMARADAQVHASGTNASSPHDARPEVHSPARSSAALPVVLESGSQHAWVPWASVAGQGLPWLWSIGCLILLVQMVRSRVQLSRLRRAASPIEESRVRVLAEHLGEIIGFSTAPELLASRAISSPVAFGVFRPTVMLPVTADAWSTERLRVVLAHELSHLRRRDPLTQLMAEAVRALHWYNPLAWLAVSRQAHDRERACDDEVLQTGSSAIDYAGHLVSMAWTVSRSQVHAESLLSLARVVGLEARIVALLAPAVRRERLTRRHRTLIAAYSMLVLCGLVLVGGVHSRPAAAISPVLRPEPEWQRAPSSAPPSVRHPSTRLPGIDPSSAALQSTDLRPEDVQRPVEPPPGESLTDPLSERIDQIASPDRPSEAELRSFKEGTLIRRLVVAAGHEALFEHDLVRERAEWALTQVQDGEIVAPLLASLEARDWRIQAYAAWALAAVGARQAGPAITPLLVHSNWRVRAQASSSLLELDSELPIQMVARLARDPAWQVRLNAVEFLRRARGSEARTVLESMLGDAHGGTRIQVAAALSEPSPR